MAYLICGDNANEIWSNALEKIKKEGDKSCDTTELLHVMLQLNHPRQSWVSCRQPAINISFALAELIWILKGDNSRRIIDYWNSSYKSYAADENSAVYHGAYGYRLRKNFGFDQLQRAYEALKNNPSNRQTVLIYWDAKQDFPNEDGSRRSRDIPCNICSMLKIRNNKLEWSQLMRSNDIHLGLPYNLVQFTHIQEIMAGWLNIGVGTYTHYSDSLHLYDRDKEKCSVQECNILNYDNLAIDKDESEILIAQIYDRMFKATEEQLESQEVKQLFLLNSKHEAYNNILAIIGVYVAKKNKYYDVERFLLEKCTNELYKKIWLNFTQQK